MLAVDVGCGNSKRDGFVGVDIIEGVDHRCDISTERLPFEDGSVEHLFSSHCLEHIPPDRVSHVFREFTRVVADGGLIEVWHPYAFHRDAHIFDHRTYLTEENYYHIAVRHPDHWLPILGHRWVLEEVRYHVEHPVLDDLRRWRVNMEYAVNHLTNVVRELGVFVRVERGPRRRSKDAFARVVCDGGRDNRALVLGTGLYRGGGAGSAHDPLPDLTIRQSARALARALGRRAARTLGRQG